MKRFDKFVFPLIRSSWGATPRFNIETTQLVYEILENLGYEVFRSTYPSIGEAGNHSQQDYLGVKTGFINVMSNRVSLNMDGIVVCEVLWVGSYIELANPAFDAYSSVDKIISALGPPN